MIRTKIRGFRGIWWFLAVFANLAKMIIDNVKVLDLFNNFAEETYRLSLIDYAENYMRKLAVFAVFRVPSLVGKSFSAELIRDM
jgi:hypothetical protein